MCGAWPEVGVMGDAYDNNDGALLIAPSYGGGGVACHSVLL